MSKAQLSIIIVDDETSIRGLLQTLLSAPDRVVQAFDAPQKAVEWLGANRVDIAFVDLMMPGMTGFELAEVIKAKYPEAHVVICTGFLAEDCAEKAKHVHADRILQKPFNLGDVMQLIHAYSN